MSNSYNLKDTEQEVLNQSFDPTYKVLAVELLAENSAGTALNRVKDVFAPVSGFDTLVVTYPSGAEKISDSISGLTFKLDGATKRTLTVTSTGANEDTLEYS